MQVTSTAKYVRISPRKTRLLLPPVRGMRADDALLQLRHRPHAGAKPLAKVIASAVANAEHNFSLDKRDLVIEQVTADQGPTFRRFKPIARGRAQNIFRKTTHLTVTLRDVPTGEPKLASKPKRAAKKAADTAKAAAKKVSPKARAKKDAESKEPKLTEGKDAKHAQHTATKAEVSQVAPRKSGRQTSRGKRG